MSKAITNIVTIASFFSILQVFVNHQAEKSNFFLGYAKNIVSISIIVMKKRRAKLD